MLACIQCKNVFVCTFMHSHYVDTSIGCTYIFKHKNFRLIEFKGTDLQVQLARGIH
jgi:hypothetical protein